MSKTAVFELQPTIFLNRSLCQSYGEECSACMLDSWTLRRSSDRKYAVLPISEVVPFKEVGSADEDIYRTSDAVRIERVSLKFTTTGCVRFRCFAFRHGGRTGEALCIGSRPYVDSVRYRGLDRSRQPVYTVLFEMMDEIGLEKDCGDRVVSVMTRADSLGDGLVLGDISASVGSQQAEKCGNVFDEVLESKPGSVLKEVVIEFNEDEYYVSGSTAECVSRQPLELVIAIEPHNRDAQVDLPIIVGVSFTSLENSDE